MKAVVLTYHAHNISGGEYATNDHVALASDLETIHGMGARIVPLREIVRRLGEREAGQELLVGLSFDDGPVFDFEDFVHPAFGPQRGFLNILRDFRARHGASAQPSLHATSFVIASPEARAALERAEECGYPFLERWLREDWWSAAVASGLMEIGNHSWDHVHHAVPAIAIASPVRDDFTQVASYDDADREIRRAADFIRARVGRCELFAYPYGHASPYLERDYLPLRAGEHGHTAAFGTGGRRIAEGTSRWNIPRCVCGEHWRSPAQLQALLA